MISLTREGCLSRRQRLWQAVPQDVEWLLVADPRHVQYLANFWVQPLSFSGGERCWLLLERSGPVTLMGDNFTIRSGVHEAIFDREVIHPWYDHKHSVINRDHALLKALQEVAPGLAGRPGLVEAEWLPMGAAEVLKSAKVTTCATQEAGESNLRDLGTVLRGLRRQKDPDELALMRQCMRAGEAGQARLFEILREGVSEGEIFREVQQVCNEAAGRPALVYGDFRAATTTLPKCGGLPTDYKVQHGDLFILDFSVVLDGYRSDFTNTMAVGAASPAAKEMFALCEAGMRGGEQVLKAGASAADVHAAVSAPYKAAGRAELFQHHAGHGIGLAHPEAPILVPQSTDRLLAGDVVTLEPGAYQVGIGGMRIEHNYLITDEGYERLSNHRIALA